MRTQMVGSLRAEDRMRSLSERSRSAAGNASTRLRAPAAVAALVFIFLVLVGSRSLILGRVSVVGQLPRWPGVGDLVESFTSAWRYVDLGSSAPAPTQLGVFATLGTLLLGATGMARTIVVVGALPFGVFGAWRLGRRITGPGSAAIVAALAYGINPVPRNALAAGRFGALVCAPPDDRLDSCASAATCRTPVRRWGAGGIGALRSQRSPSALLLRSSWRSLALAQLLAWRRRSAALGAAAVTGVEPRCRRGVSVPPAETGWGTGLRSADLNLERPALPDRPSVWRGELVIAGAGCSCWSSRPTDSSGDPGLGAGPAPRVRLAASAALPRRVDAGGRGLLVPAAPGIAAVVSSPRSSRNTPVRFGWRQVTAVEVPSLSFPSSRSRLMPSTSVAQPASDWNQNLPWMRSGTRAASSGCSGWRSGSAPDRSGGAGGRIRHDQRRTMPDEPAAAGRRCLRCRRPSTSCNATARSARMVLGVRYPPSA